MSMRGDVRRAAGLGTRAWLDLLRAAGELAIARLRLPAQGAERLLGPSGDSPSNALASGPDQTLIDRVAFAIPRAAARVPWRSTCLVQALAAQRWLARSGVASQLVLGARKPDGADMEAHAWLKAGTRIVVGGDPGDYEPFTPSRPA